MGVELVEYNKNPHTGDVLESTENHISDIVFFVCGWILAQLLYKNYIKNSKIYNNKLVYFILLILFTIFTFTEYYKEIFPYNKYNGVFL